MGYGRIRRHFGRHLTAGIVVGVLSVGFVVPAAGAATVPVAWQATVGTATTNQAVQVNAFLPGEITVDAGDSITWNLGSGEFHTVTFLSGTDAPPLIGPGPSLNLPAILPAGGSTYDGTGFHNSGLLPDVAGPSYTLTFTQAGSFPFLCLIHAGMNGLVHVQDAGTAYPQTQAQYDNRALVTGNHLKAAGRNLQARSLAWARSSGAGQAVVGTGAAISDIGSLAVMRFLPGRLVVHAGDTVTWANNDPETPHTITFGPEPGGGPLGAFFPSGSVAPGNPWHATLSDPDEAANSGFIGANLPFGSMFAATFTAPGTYRYICALHDTLGMTGTVVVLP